MSGVDLPPEPGFDDPLQMLWACHQHIRGQLETLQRLANHLSMFGVDARARQAAEDLVRYFDTAAPHHHADEEEDLFPAVRAAAQGEARQRLETLIATLRQEHERMSAAWAGLRPVLVAVATGEMADLTIEHAMAFDTLYDAHMGREERGIFPIAARLLDAEQIRAIGAAMTARRAPQSG